MVLAEAVEQWRRAIDRRDLQTQVLEIESLRRYSLAVGDDGSVAGGLPPLAHWAFFLSSPTDEAIGPDGHPRSGEFLPDITLPRRMFAGSRIEFRAPLRLGEEADLVTTIADVRHRTGSTGHLVFVEVERTISQAGICCAREVQTYVYRDEGEPVPLPDPAASPPDGECWVPDEVNLFRFSAATFNSHRIHYDLPYATQSEGYPALVVHGPFTAAKLAGLAMRAGPLAAFQFRALAPLFLGQPIYLRDAGQGRVEAARCDGVVAMRAEFTLA
ncbi:FAS1-like dehydratase domain-containing protein [Tsuneonella sp. HG249]